MTDTLKDRVDQFNRLSLPGQFSITHIGIGCLVNDLWNEVESLRSGEDAFRQQLVAAFTAAADASGDDALESCEVVVPTGILPFIIATIERLKSRGDELSAEVNRLWMDNQVHHGVANARLDEMIRLRQRADFAERENDELRGMVAQQVMAD